MENRKELHALIEKHGFTDFKWINPKDIVVSQGNHHSIIQKKIESIYNIKIILYSSARIIMFFIPLPFAGKTIIAIDHVVTVL